MGSRSMVPITPSTNNALEVPPDAAAAGEERWWYVRNGQRHGPVPPDELAWPIFQEEASSPRSCFWKPSTQF